MLLTINGNASGTKATATVSIDDDDIENIVVDIEIRADNAQYLTGIRTAASLNSNSDQIELFIGQFVDITLVYKKNTYLEYELPNWTSGTTTKVTATLCQDDDSEDTPINVGITFNITAKNGRSSIAETVSNFTATIKSLENIAFGTNADDKVSFIDGVASAATSAGWDYDDDDDDDDDDESNDDFIYSTIKFAENIKSVAGLEKSMIGYMMNLSSYSIEADNDVENMEVRYGVVNQYTFTVTTSFDTDSYYIDDESALSFRLVLLLGELDS